MSLKRTTSNDASPRALLLVRTERSRSSSEPPTPPSEPVEAAELRARLDEALEDIAFLREQLCSADAWSAHRIETLRARHRVAHEIFVRDLARLMEGLRLHARVLDDVEDGERPPTFDVAANHDAEHMESER